MNAWTSTNDGRLALKARRWGALPVVNHFIRRLGIETRLTQALTTDDPRQRLHPATALGLLLRNLILARRPLYAIGEWAQSFDPSQLGLSEIQCHHLNDDQIGRALDRFFDAPRSSLLMGVVIQAIRQFGLQLNELHNDSTTLTFFGQYRTADGRLKRGQPTLRITWGHNKDHRPDLKQLLLGLTLTADGAVPIHYHAYDGNTTDDTTHRETWDLLRNLAGKSDFLYVADCKLCTASNLRHIHQNRGRFVTVMPRTRTETKWFERWAQKNTIPWVEVGRRPNPRRPDGPKEVFRAYESPMSSSEGYRIVWFHSNEKQKRDQAERADRILEAFRALERLKQRLASTRCRLRHRAKVDRAVEAAAGIAQRWIEVRVQTKTERKFRKVGRGRPGKNARYRSVTRPRYTLDWISKVEMVEADARLDGIFPLITNDRKLSVAELLWAYKRQPLLEKRHAQWKNVEWIWPQYLKSPSRIEAFLGIFFLALLVDTLIERQLRQALKARRQTSLPLYPEERECKCPTTRRVMEIFDEVSTYRLYQNQRLVQIFKPELVPLQKEVLELLKLPATIYLPQ